MSTAEKKASEQVKGPLEGANSGTGRVEGGRHKMSADLSQIFGCYV